MTNTLTFSNLTRYLATGSHEQLELRNGVNILLGEPNTGKTKWLAMLDYLLGDDDPPEKEFGLALKEKYIGASVDMNIGNEIYNIKRYWNEPGSRSKIHFNGATINPEEFSSNIFEALGWDLLRYPQGDPSNARMWKTLGWRSLYRHMYRQEDYWSDIADKQFPVEQHACVLYFLGLAQKLYSKDRSAVIEMDRQRQKLEVEKEQYIQILSDISNELLVENIVQVTADSILAAKRDLNNQELELDHKRKLILTEIKNKVEQNEREKLGYLETEWAKSNIQTESLTNEMSKLENRVSEISEYREGLEGELQRIKRALVAGDVLADFRITTCPVCDQPVDNQRAADSKCFLCLQEVSREPNSKHSYLETELCHLDDNIKETDKLLNSLQSLFPSIKTQLKTETERLDTLNAQLKLYREQSNAITSPELSEIDMAKGRIQERIRQLDRINDALKKRDEISKRLDQLTNKINNIEAILAQSDNNIDFNVAADALSDGMNTYLNELTKRYPQIWKQEAVRVKLNDRRFDIYIGKALAKQQLGGSNKLRLWMSYHYSLLKLTNENGRCYPGLVVIDLPPRLEDDAILGDKEKFIMEPFAELISSRDIPMQMIVSGRALHGFENANTIELSTVWTHE